MHARVSTYQFQPDKIDAAIDRFESTRSDPGLDAMKESLVLVDRSTGKAISITLWDDAEAVAASRETADRARAGAAEAGGGTIESVEEFEVARRQ